MKVVRLKNGTEEVEGIVWITMLHLSSLIKGDPISFYELVMKCRDRNHNIFSGVQEEKLQDLNLLDSTGTVHDSIVNIVVSAVEGNRSKMMLVSPLAK